MVTKVNIDKYNNVTNDGPLKSVITELEFIMKVKLV